MKQELRNLIMLFIFLLSSSMTIGQTKIVVLSDPHVMAPELLVNEGSAWTDFLSADRKLVDYSQTLFDLMISKIKDDIQPDMVLITGDLTKDGEALSHQYVADKLEELTDVGIKALVIPGNHDWGTSNAKYYNGASTSDAATLIKSQLATLYADYGLGSSDREETTLTYACEPIAGLVVIGIDSGADGQLSSTTLNWVCNKAKAAYNDGKQVIAMMHHPLIPHFTGADSFVEAVSIANYENVRNALADAGVRVIFTGHFHTSDIAKDFNLDLSKTIYDVNTGSLISYPCDYRVATLSADMKTMNITTSSISEITSGDGFATIAKTRLAASVSALVTSKGEPFASMSAQLAGMFIYHAEGDEHSSPEAQAFLTTYGSTLPIAIQPLAYSVLDDYSNYGDVNRQDRTADRNLNITLPTLTESITLAADGWSTYCSEQAIDLSKTAGVTGYIVSAIGASSVSLETVTKVPANTGFIINGTGSQAYTLHATLSATDDVTANKLSGTLVATSAPANSFALSTQSGVTGFYPITTGLSIPAHKAYLVTSTDARILMMDGVPTAIDAPTSAFSYQPSAFYTLQGVQVSRPTKGVYINNGRLVIIK